MAHHRPVVLMYDTSLTSGNNVWHIIDQWYYCMAHHRPVVLMYGTSSTSGNNV